MNKTLHVNSTLRAKMLFSKVEVAGGPDSTELCSPPHGWPARFSKDRALNAFIGSGRLRGRRCRLTALPPAHLLAEASAAGVTLHPQDSRANAESLHAAMSWGVVKGFAVFELTAQPGVFAALSRQWNDVSGVWVDLTPRLDAHASMVLVESDFDPESGASGETSAAGGAAQPEGMPRVAVGPTERPLDGGGVLTASGERWRPSTGAKKSSSLSMLELSERWEALVEDDAFRADVSTLRDQRKLHDYLGTTLTTTPTSCKYIFLSNKHLAHKHTQRRAPAHCTCTQRAGPI